ncbi:hypothetical protein B0T22DRAFT_436393 [Podospora appendiculata]|uniref:Uncharacterized protein n=1 Tax=Podospora appendiculata TaxID=314037 RepID=A0AAE0XGX2_9PEZI|nr:hypothetical protein B0T22DRAFT_436393 [Podospora appendiculata]
MLICIFSVTLHLSRQFLAGSPTPTRRKLSYIGTGVLISVFVALSITNCVLLGNPSNIDIKTMDLIPPSTILFFAQAGWVMTIYISILTSNLVKIVHASRAKVLWLRGLHWGAGHAPWSISALRHLGLRSMKPSAREKAEVDRYV